MRRRQTRPRRPHPPHHSRQAGPHPPRSTPGDNAKIRPKPIADQSIFTAAPENKDRHPHPHPHPSDAYPNHSTQKRRSEAATAVELVKGKVEEANGARGGPRLVQRQGGVEAEPEVRSQLRRGRRRPPQVRRQLEADGFGALGHSRGAHAITPEPSKNKTLTHTHKHTHTDTRTSTASRKRERRAAWLGVTLSCSKQKAMWRSVSTIATRAPGSSPASESRNRSRTFWRKVIREKKFFEGCQENMARVKNLTSPQRNQLHYKEIQSRKLASYRWKEQHRGGGRAFAVSKALVGVTGQLQQFKALGRVAVQ